MTRLDKLYETLIAEWEGQHRNEITIPLLEAIWEEEIRPDPSLVVEGRTGHRSCPSGSDSGHENDLS
jgi:hypothetical protein